MWMQVTALAVICVFILQDSAWAADAASSSGYLSGYENPDPRPSPVSWWSTLAYLLSLLVIFGFLLGVTESNVSMLAEITDPREIESLERESALLPQQAEGTMFTSQLGALADFVSRFRKS